MGWRGHQRSFSDAAIQTCLSMKVLSGMALRQTTGGVESLRQLVDRQKARAVNIPDRAPRGRCTC